MAHKLEMLGRMWILPIIFTHFSREKDMPKLKDHPVVQKLRKNYRRGLLEKHQYRNGVLLHLEDEINRETSDVYYNVVYRTSDGIPVEQK